MHKDWRKAGAPKGKLYVRRPASTAAGEGPLEVLVEECVSPPPPPGGGGGGRDSDETKRIAKKLGYDWWRSASRCRPHPFLLGAGFR